MGRKALHPSSPVASSSTTAGTSEEEGLHARPLLRILEVAFNVVSGDLGGGRIALRPAMSACTSEEEGQALLLTMSVYTSEGGRQAPDLALTRASSEGGKQVPDLACAGRHVVVVAKVASNGAVPSRRK